MLPLPALIDQRQLEQGPHVRPFACKRNENRHVYRVVLGILPVRVEVNRPIEPSNGEHVAGNVLPRPHPLCERIPPDREPVRPIRGLDQRSRGRAARLCPVSPRVELVCSGLCGSRTHDA